LKHKSKDRALARQTLLQKKHELQVTLDSLLVKLDKLYEIDRMLSEGCRKRIEEYQSNMEELKNIHLQIEQLREEIKNISQLIERSPIQQLESLIMNAKGIEAQVDQISLQLVLIARKLQLAIDMIQNEKQCKNVLISEIREAWPEIAALAEKVVQGQSFFGLDARNFKELADVTGWDEADLREELAKLAEDPSESVARYRELFEKYHREALDFFAKGDTRQAAEKLWASALALVKLYAASQGIFVAHWSRARIDDVIANNVEREHRKLFRELVDKAQVLHEHFYEGNLNEELFRERWSEVLELLERVKEIVYKKLQR